MRPPLAALLVQSQPLGCFSSLICRFCRPGLLCNYRWARRHRHEGEGQRWCAQLGLMVPSRATASRGQVTGSWAQNWSPTPPAQPPLKAHQAFRICRWLSSTLTGCCGCGHCHVHKGVWSACCLSMSSMLSPMSLSSYCLPPSTACTLCTRVCQRCNPTTPRLVLLESLLVCQQIVHVGLMHQ